MIEGMDDMTVEEVMRITLENVKADYERKSKYMGLTEREAFILEQMKEALQATKDEEDEKQT